MFKFTVGRIVSQCKGKELFLKYYVLFHSLEEKKLSSSQNIVYFLFLN